jgi:hypothetical protein
MNLLLNLLCVPPPSSIIARVEENQFAGMKAFVLSYNELDLSRC